MIVARILFALLSAFSYPLQTHPCRASLLNIAPVPRGWKVHHPNALFYSLTILILGGSYLFAFFQQDLRLVSRVIGTVAGIPICYIFPFLFYYKLTEDQPWGWKKYAAAGLAVFGLAAMALSGAATLMSMIEPRKPAPLP